MYQSPLEIWVSKDTILPGKSFVPLMRHHEEEPKSNDELEFWNELRNKLSDLVEIKYFENLGEAGEFVLIPHDVHVYFHRFGLQEFRKVSDFSAEVTKSGRKSIVFPGSGELAPRNNEIFFSYSVYQNPTEYVVSTPAWLYDMHKKVGELEKPDVPTIGFMGDMHHSGKASMLLRNIPGSKKLIELAAGNAFLNRNMSLKWRRPLARIIRERVLESIKKDNKLKASFVERNSGFFSRSEEEKSKDRLNYIMNIANNAYTLCVRGTENFSYRLYEVMSASRIPLIIDTNMKLPDLGPISWKDFSVIVKYSEIHRISDIVREFHNEMSNEDFKARCKKARQAFEYLLPHNFFSRIFEDNIMEEVTSLLSQANTSTNASSWRNI